MNKIFELQSLYNSLNEEERLLINFKSLRIGTMNLISTLGLPAKNYFIRFFLCGENSKDAKLANLLRFRRAYRDFLLMKSKAFSSTESIEELEVLIKNRSNVQRFSYIQGFIQSKYGVPIILSKDVINNSILDIDELELCIIKTIALIEMEESK